MNRTRPPSRRVASEAAHPRRTQILKELAAYAGPAALRELGLRAGSDVSPCYGGALERNHV